MRESRQAVAARRQQVRRVRRPSRYYEFYALGAGDPFPVSAQNSAGIGRPARRRGRADCRTGLEEEPDALRVAVIGRPNVGKSSFVNRLLGEDRLVVTDVAGTTRDAIDSPMSYHGRELDLRRHGGPAAADAC